MSKLAFHMNQKSLINRVDLLWNMNKLGIGAEETGTLDFEVKKLLQRHTAVSHISSFYVY